MREEWTSALSTRPTKFVEIEKRKFTYKDNEPDDRYYILEEWPIFKASSP